MKIQYFSDLHLEFRSDDVNKFLSSIVQEADVLVIAGDLHLCKYLYNVFEFLSPLYPHIVYVTGNHEYYGSTPTVVHKVLEGCQKEFKNLHWLNNSLVEIDGQRFLGGTCWFRDQIANRKYANRLSDFLVIQDFVPWVYEENTRFIKFLEKNLKKDDIVVTHHMPTHKSTPDFFRNSELNRFFVCDLVDYIINREPSYWIHGHTHSSCAYRYDATEVRCNPFGYARQAENWDFKDNLILEV